MRLRALADAAAERKRPFGMLHSKGPFFLCPVLADEHFYQ